MGKVITLGSEKGGTGKSTLATNIAAALSLKGQKTFLIDADTQHSVYRWSLDRLKNEDLKYVACAQSGGNIKPLIQELSQSCDWLIVDTKAGTPKELRIALLHSDLCLVPVRPTQLDLDTLQYVENLVEECKDINNRLQPLIVLTQVSTHAQDTSHAQAQQYCKDNLKMQLLNTIIFNRKTYQDAMPAGMGVCEADNEKCKNEIESLIRELEL